MLYVYHGMFLCKQKAWLKAMSFVQVLCRNLFFSGFVLFVTRRGRTHNSILCLIPCSTNKRHDSVGKGITFSDAFYSWEISWVSFTIICSKWQFNRKLPWGFQLFAESPLYSVSLQLQKSTLKWCTREWYTLHSGTLWHAAIVSARLLVAICSAESQSDNESSNKLTNCGLHDSLWMRNGAWWYSS